jgi:putative NIF3 family GTP cyclohydrolase 1 type 2
MKLSELRTYLTTLFGEDKLADKNEWGFTVELDSIISKVGYATNLVPETVQEAARRDVNLLLTHHDAWDFLYGMKAECVQTLKDRWMSHLFVHLPLDDADFGTNVALMEAIGARVVERSNRQGVYATGAIGEFDRPVPFNELVAQVEHAIGEQVLSWQNCSGPIRRVGLATGGGLMTHNVHEAVQKGCDVYITGERVLYTVQYAKYAGIDLIVGSHTLTEILGVECMAQKLRDRFPHIHLVRVPEEHLEVRGVGQSV